MQTDIVQSAYQQVQGIVRPIASEDIAVQTYRLHLQFQNTEALHPIDVNFVICPTILKIAGESRSTIYKTKQGDHRKLNKKQESCLSLKQN